MDDVGSVEIVIKGGRPWGFILQGGIESRTALTVAQIEPRGKADLQGALRVGDHVLKINDVQCFALADATQLIDCAFRTLTVLIWRSKSAVGVPTAPTLQSPSYGMPRYHRLYPKDEGLVVRRISASSSKALLRSTDKDYRHQPQIPITKYKSLPQVTLTCDSHENRTYSEDVECDRRPLIAHSYSSQPFVGSVDRSNSSLSLASTTDSQQDVAFYLNDTSSRHSRSPRNLTKDSGYETSAQGDHDYVNVEWIASSEIQNPTSPGQRTVPNKKRPANNNSVFISSKGERSDNLSRYSTPSTCSPQDSEQSERSLVDIRDFSKDSAPRVPYCSESENPSSSVVPVGKRTGSYGSLYSSSESLSPRPSKTDGKFLRSAKSSLSLVDKSKSKQSVPSHVQHVVTSCQYFSTVVSPAQSAPNLRSQDEMAPRRVSKKQSIYEELACKSGFDFSPVVQRPRFWSQKDTLKGNAFLRNPSICTEDPEVREPCSLPGNCDNPSSCETMHSYYTSVETVQSFKTPSQSTDVLNSPPPVPARDSSLKYRSNSTHEKYPSWPVSLPAETEAYSTGQSGCRSNSWTEQTRCAKDHNGSYSRPQNHYQISTQQLPPVQEKTRKTELKLAVQSNQGLLADKIASYKFEQDSASSPDMMLGMLNKHFTSYKVRQKGDKAFRNVKHCDTHSPPERDVTSPEGKPRNKRRGEDHRIDRCENNSNSSSHPSALYENVRRSGSLSHCNNSTTPLLDRLRLEKESLPTWSSTKDNDAYSDAGTCVSSSNSSSQETLKWRGSYSDLSSLNTCPRNGSPSFESDGSTTCDELALVSIDSSVRSYSSSPSEGSTGGGYKSGHWQHLNSITHYGVTHKQSEETPNKYLEPKKRGYSMRNSGHLQCNFSAEVSPDCSRFASPSHPFHSRSIVDESYYSSSETCLNDDSSLCSETSGKYVRPSNVGKNSSNSISFSSPTDTSANLIQSQFSPQSSGKKESRSTKYSLSCWPSQRQEIGFIRNSPGNLREKNSSVAWELKAIQKQAVLSFYHRQTATAGKDATGNKTPRSSSFSYGHENTVGEGWPSQSEAPVTKLQTKCSLSSNSLSQPIPDIEPARCPEVTVNRQKEVVGKHRAFLQESHTEQCLPHCPAQTDYAVDSSITEDSHLNPKDLERLEDEEKHPLEAIRLSKELVEEGSNNSESERSLRIKVPGRKAILKKIYNADESEVVKVISSKREKFPHSVRSSNVVVKPLVPPKRVLRDVTVQLPAMSRGSSPENKDEDELRAIEEGAFDLCEPLRGVFLSSSPDLPLPPPPLNAGTEVLPTDDPLPPPPPPNLLIYPGVETSYFTSGKISVVASKDHSSPELYYGNVRPANDNMVPLVDTSPDKAELTALDRSTGVPSVSSVRSNKEPEKERLEKQGESEAIYVNLDFRNRLYQKLIQQSTPKPFSITPAISVTNTATQTSDTPSLQRKAINFERSAHSLEYSGCIFDLAGRNPKPGHDTAISLSNQPESLDGVINLHLKRSENSEISTDSNQQSHHSPEVAPRDDDAPRDDIGLPLTSPYFTTSEPKAKLLTRYCQSFDKEWISQLELKGQKEVLIASISKKLNILRLEQVELKEEMKQNEELGQEVTAKIEKLAKPNELQKYRVHVEELEKIINLLLSLSGRLARAENALLILPKDAKAEEKSILEAKRNKLSQQHEEAWHLKENIDRRSCQVSFFLHHYLSKEEYADYEHFIKMKSKLLMDAREIDEKIKLGEEQLAALRGTFQAQQRNGDTNNDSEKLTERKVLDKK